MQIAITTDRMLYADVGVFKGFVYPTPFDTVTERYRIYEEADTIDLTADSDAGMQYSGGYMRINMNVEDEQPRKRIRYEEFMILSPSGPRVCIDLTHELDYM